VLIVNAGKSFVAAT